MRKYLAVTFTCPAIIVSAITVLTARNTAEGADGDVAYAAHGVSETANERK